MNTPDNALPDPDQLCQELIDSGEISYGVITGGLCDTPEHQAEFDQHQKGKPPLLRKRRPRKLPEKKRNNSTLLDYIITIFRIVIPAWIAGIQAPCMDWNLPSMILDTRFPAGMTSLRVNLTK